MAWIRNHTLPPKQQQVGPNFSLGFLVHAALRCCTWLINMGPPGSRVTLYTCLAYLPVTLCTCLAHLLVTLCTCLAYLPVSLCTCLALLPVTLCSWSLQLAHSPRHLPLPTITAEHAHALRCATARSPCRRPSRHKLPCWLRV